MAARPAPELLQCMRAEQLRLILHCWIPSFIVTNVDDVGWLTHAHERSHACTIIHTQLRLLALAT
jgi:hypothetical protein